MSFVTPYAHQLFCKQLISTLENIKTANPRKKHLIEHHIEILEAEIQHLNTTYSTFQSKIEEMEDLLREYAKLKEKTRMQLRRIKIDVGRK